MTTSPLPRRFYANPYAATRIKDDIGDVLLLSVIIFFGKRDLISFWLEELASPPHHSFLSTGGPSFLKSYKMFIHIQSTLVLLLSLSSAKSKILLPKHPLVLRCVLDDSPINLETAVLFACDF